MRGSIDGRAQMPWQTAFAHPVPHFGALETALALCTFVKVLELEGIGIRRLSASTFWAGIVYYRTASTGGTSTGVRRISGRFQVFLMGGTTSDLGVPSHSPLEGEFFWDKRARMEWQKGLAKQNPTAGAFTQSEVRPLQASFLSDRLKARFAHLFA